MKIRLAAASEIECIERIYESARAFMKKSGNPDQWKEGYPPRALILSDIEDENLYVCEGDGGELLGVFFYRFGQDET